MKAGLQLARHQRFALAVVIAGMLLLGGCTLPERGSYEVDFDGTPEQTLDGFRMQGQVEIDTTAAPTRNFSEVTVVLYNQNESVVNRVPVGTMSTNPEHYPVRRSVNITATEAPAYILIESPDFWSGDVSVTAYRWTGEDYENVHVESRRGIFEG